MGKAKTFTPQAAVDSTQRAPSGVSTVIRPFTSDKATHMPASVGSFQHPSPVGHVSPATSTYLSFQPSSSQVPAPAMSTGLPNSNLSATARVERPHLRSDGRANGLSQVPGLYFWQQFMLLFFFANLFNLFYLLLHCSNCLIRS